MAKGKRILVGKVVKGGYNGKKKDKWERGDQEEWEKGDR